MFGMTAYSLFYSAPAETDAKKATATTYSFEKKTTSSKKKNAVQKALPDSNAKDWNLVLVGPKNKIENEVAESQLATLSDNSHQVDSRIAADYEDFSEAATKAGFPLVIISAFRSVESQKEVFDTNVNGLVSGNGMTEEEQLLKLRKPSQNLAIVSIIQDWLSISLIKIGTIPIKHRYWMLPMGISQELNGSLKMHQNMVLSFVIQRIGKILPALLMNLGIFAMLVRKMQSISLSTT